VSEVSRAFPEVPQRTLYDWAKLQEQTLSPPLAKLLDIEARTVDIQGFADSANNSADSASLKVVPFRGERSALRSSASLSPTYHPSPQRAAYSEESEFNIAVRTVRDIADNYNAPVLKLVPIVP
jgi:hypothetical protein